MDENQLNTSVENLKFAIDEIRIGQEFIKLSSEESCPFYMGILGPDGKWAWVNKKMSNDIGLPKSEIEGQHFTKFISEDSEEVLKDFESDQGDGVSYTGYPALYKMASGPVIVEWWSTHTEKSNGLILSIGLPTNDSNTYSNFKQTNRK